MICVYILTSACMLHNHEPKKINFWKYFFLVNDNYLTNDFLIFVAHKENGSGYVFEE